MDSLNSRCNNVTEEYKQKYDKLLSLVNGYEIANNTQNESMKSLSNIINNTKELISESEFETLKNEQKNIMADFAKLETMKNEPYSNESLEFTSGKPKRYMEEIVEEEENTHNKRKNQTPKSYIEEIVEEEEDTRNEMKKNNLAKSIEKSFSLDSLNNIKSKNNKDIIPVQPQPQDVNRMIRDNNNKMLQNYYGDKNYQVYSNYQQGGPPTQMPTIQIVNVQEAPKDFNLKRNMPPKKDNLKNNVNNMLEKSLNDFDISKMNRNKKRDKFKKNVDKILDNLDMPRIIRSQSQTRNPKITSSTKKNIPKPRKKTRNRLDHFKEFINNYTEGVVVKTLEQKKPKTKKCNKKPFASKFQDKTNNHSIF